MKKKGRWARICIVCFALMFIGVLCSGLALGATMALFAVLTSRPDALPLAYQGMAIGAAVGTLATAAVLTKQWIFEADMYFYYGRGGDDD